MYVTLGIRTRGGLSAEGGSSATRFVDDGGRTIGRPANRGLIELLESFRLCGSARVGIIGMLLLVGKAGRSSGTSDVPLASVSVRLKLVNLDGGNGLEPEGRESLLLRRSSR